MDILGDKIDDLLEKLQNVVDGSLEKANTLLIAAETAVNHTAAVVENEAEVSLRGLQSSFEKVLDELKVKSAKAGVNIDECLEENEKILVNLPTSTADDVVQCVQSLAIQPVRYISEALNEVLTNYY